MSQYIWYKFDQNSPTIKNYGVGGAAFNAVAVRNQYALNVLKNPRWGPLNQNNDGIRCPGGIRSPTQHTWQIGLNISQFWPVLGIDDQGILCGNDGKLWSIAKNQYYAYLHTECSTASGSLVCSNVHHFTIELAGSGSAYEDGIQFYLGVEDQRPHRITTDGDMGSEGGRSWWDFNFDLQLNTNYYFQIAVNLNPNSWIQSNSYSIGNCLETGSPCADSKVTGFPAGCHFYSWREDDTALDLSQGGNWSDDAPLWAGGQINRRKAAIRPTTTK
jgi:hypothetical protein